MKAPITLFLALLSVAAMAQLKPLNSYPDKGTYLYPIAFWTTAQWLQEYAYRVEVGCWVFIAAGIAATAIAFITISYQAVKSAISNPVQSLRSE